MSSALLLVDVGGTHTRVALVDNRADAPIAPELWPTASLVPDPGRWLAAHVAARGAPAIAGVVLCGAGPLRLDGDDSVIELTNHPLRLSARALATTLALAPQRVSLVNDFAAVAAGVPWLQPGDLRWHSGATALQPPSLLLGAGTGLGMSAWLGGTQTLAGEGGHVALSGVDARERELLTRLADADGFTCAEDFLCGPGYARAYGVLRALDGLTADAVTPADVHRLAERGDAHARETRARFTAALGRVAGDAALTLGARSVLLAGGIVPAWGTAFDVAAFRHAMTAKGRYGAYLRQVVSATVTHPQPAMPGLRALAAALAG